MGLDMYLFRKEEDGSSVDVGYWRKANAIHNWFVQNVQDGVDECRPAEVSVAKLEALRAIVKEVLKGAKKGDFSLAESLLPTQSGFFFGGTDYDNWYVEDLKSTLKILDKAIAVGKPCIYKSSW